MLAVARLALPLAQLPRASNYLLYDAQSYGLEKRFVTVSRVHGKERTVEAMPKQFHEG